MQRANGVQTLIEKSRGVADYVTMDVGGSIGSRSEFFGESRLLT